MEKFFTKHQLVLFALQHFDGAELKNYIQSVADIHAFLRTFPECLLNKLDMAVEHCNIFLKNHQIDGTFMLIPEYDTARLYLADHNDAKLLGIL